MVKSMKFRVYGECMNAPDTITVNLKGVSPPMVWNVVDEKIHASAKRYGCLVKKINHAGKTVTLKDKEVHW